MELHTLGNNITQIEKDLTFLVEKSHSLKKPEVIQTVFEMRSLESHLVDRADKLRGIF